MIRENVFTGGAFIVAVASSLCCILPVVAVVFGLGAFSVASTFESLRPYLLLVVFVALAFGFYQTYFRRKKCEDDQACATKPVGIVNQIVLCTATIFVLAIVAFPYYSGRLLTALEKSSVSQTEVPNSSVEKTAEDQPVQSNDQLPVAESEAQNLKTVVIAVEGMTCEGCASQLNVALKRVKGVVSAEASYPNKNVTVVYNPKQVTIERIRKAIYDAGYTPK